MNKSKTLKGKKKEMSGREEIDQGVKSFEKRYREGKMKGSGIHSNVSFSPKSEKEKRLFNKAFNSKTA